MIVKIAGAALMVACGGVLGFGRLRLAGGRIALLEKLDRALAMIEAEISLCCRALPDVFERLWEELDEELFRELSENCAAMSAGEAWKKWASALELPPEGKRALCALGDILGRYDASRQSAEIYAARDMLRTLREKLQREKDVKQNNYPLLGACLAGIAAMLMI